MRTMLGIDITEEFIRVVDMRRRGGDIVLHRAMEIPIAAEQSSDATSLGQLLRESLRRQGWTANKAVITLPRRLCFVRRFSVGDLPTEPGHAGKLSKHQVEAVLAVARQSILVPVEELVFDVWSSSSATVEEPYSESDGNVVAGAVLLGTAQKKSVDFCRRLASSAELKIQSLELRPLAAVNGLLFHWHEAREEIIAVSYVEGGYAEVAVMDAEGLLSLQSLKVQSAENDDRLSLDLSGQLLRVFNTLKLSKSGAVPERLFLSLVDDAIVSPAATAAKVEKKLAIPVSICDQPVGLIVRAAGKELALSKYVPAIGASLDGLSMSPTWFDFLHPRGKIEEKKRHVSWKPLVLAVAAIVVAAMVFWFSLVQQRWNRLRLLDARIARMAPDRTKMLDAKDNWRLMRPYLPTSFGGSRREYLYIIGEISRLFPDTKDAYITDLDITERSVGSSAGNYDIKITGNVREGEIVTGFVDRLNGSEMFYEAKPGPRTSVPGNSYYSFKFSVTCRLRRETGSDKL